MSEKLKSLIEDVLNKVGDDTEAAIGMAYRRWKKYAEFEEWATSVERRQIANEINEFRHARNRELRKKSGVYGAQAKVEACSDAIGVACLAGILVTYSVNGRPLGSLRGEELPGLAKAERNRAAGHNFNAALLGRLAEMVETEQAVADVVTEEQVAEMFDEIGKKFRT